MLKLVVHKVTTGVYVPPFIVSLVSIKPLIGNKVKVKVTLERTMKAQRGSIGTVTVTLSFTIAHGEGVWLLPHPKWFIPFKETQYLLYRKLGGPQGHSGEVQKICGQKCLLSKMCFSQSTVNSKLCVFVV